MPKIVDWSGQKFFFLTIKEKLNCKSNSGSWLWSAQCDCGIIIHTVPFQIKKGAVKHCGCKKTTTAKDWTGKTYNSLTFIKPAGRTTGSKIRWEVLCKCGRTSTVIPYSISRGYQKTCGKCERPDQSKNWENYQIGNLTFIKRHRTYSNGAMVWEAFCSCGNTIYTVPSANAKSCGCLGKEASKKWCSILGKRGRKYHPDISVARQVWQRYKDHDIDFETFYKLSQSTCNYCGITPLAIYSDNGGTFIYNGLDRIDSTKYHTIDNVVPCCWECNESKNDKTVEKFLAHSKRIIDYQNKILIP